MKDYSIVSLIIIGTYKITIAITFLKTGLNGYAGMVLSIEHKIKRNYSFQNTPTVFFANSFFSEILARGG